LDDNKGLEMSNYRYGAEPHTTTSSVDTWATRSSVTADLMRVLPTWSGTLPTSIPLLLSALANHDAGTYAHSLRVARMAWWLARILGGTSRHHDEVMLTGLLHDVGKINIPRTLLQKRGPLSHHEQTTIERQVQCGAQIVQQFADVAGLGAAIAAQYERPDGYGVPDGRVRHEIPPAALILAVADAIDEMASQYSSYAINPSALHVICETLMDGAGTRWDGHVATVAAQRLAPAPAMPQIGTDLERHAVELMLVA